MFLSNKSISFLENEPVESVIVQCKKAFPYDSGLVLRVRITFEGILFNYTDTNMGNFKWEVKQRDLLFSIIHGIHRNRER